MKIENIKIKVALLALICYQIGMGMFALDGLSVAKLALILFLWLSFSMGAVEFMTQMKQIKKLLPYLPMLLLSALLLYNVFSVLVSFYEKSDTVTTIIGNDYASLAILIPVVFVFALKINYLNYINKILLKMMFWGLILSPLVLVIPKGALPFAMSKIVITLLSPAIFVIAAFPFLNKKNTIIIVASLVLLLLISYFAGGRTMVLRELLLISALFALKIYQKYNIKSILITSYFVLLLPLYLIHDSISSGESAFETYLSKSSDDELNVDTRTFLYLELYNDLDLNDKLLFGKGAVGRYYSSYFAENDGDGANRLVSEVGVLGILLKGGLVAVILNLTIFFMAIYYSFFKSKNLFVKGLGYILLVHVILLFIENLIVYNIYNLLLWISVGICLSKKTRLMSNNQIKHYLFAST